MHVRTSYILCVSTVYRYNQKIAILGARFKKEGKDPWPVVPTMNVEPYMRGEGLKPPWFMNSPQLAAHAGRFMNVHDDQVELAMASTSSVQPRPVHAPLLT
jgi:hypothetical protein